jgi:ubiquinone/menaquinone biosynthesis C-methylase UbiE
MMAKAFPSLTLVGIDGDAHSLSKAAENLAKAGVGDRVTLRQQTFESIDIEGGFDFAYMNISLHEARDKPATVVNCYRALNAGGMLAVSELPFPEDQASLRSDAGGLLSLMQLHEVYFGGHHLTVREAQDLLKEAGFADIGVIPVTALQVVHHGTRPT